MYYLLYSKVLFGNVNNPVDEETDVVLEIAYNTDPAIAEGSHTPPDVKVGSIDVTMEEFTVVKNVRESRYFFRS